MRIRGVMAETALYCFDLSTFTLSSGSAQILYIISCGKTSGKDGVDPKKVYVTVTPKSVTVTDLN